MTPLPVLILAVLRLTQPEVLESTYSARHLEMVANPSREEWAAAPRVLAARDRMGQPVAGPPMEIRSQWTRDHLYLLFVCPYTSLNVTPAPDARVETERLWHRDVVEAFIGTDFENIGQYKEFQASPQGEWADLDINRASPAKAQGSRWASGFTVKAQIDVAHRTWYALMRIPFRAIASRPPASGMELRLGLFRIAGDTEPRTRYVWQPTGQATFHVPEAFGILRLR